MAGEVIGESTELSVAHFKQTMYGVATVELLGGGLVSAIVGELADSTALRIASLVLAIPGVYTGFKSGEQLALANQIAQREGDPGTQ